MPLTRAGFANVPEVPMSGRHLTLVRPSDTAGQDLPDHLPDGDGFGAFCCFGVRRNESGNPIGAAVAYGVDVERETVHMAIRLDPDLVESEDEAEAAGLFLNYLFELHRFRQVFIDDRRVTRHRPLVVLAESQSGEGGLKDRAAWERNVRAGRSQRLSITVQGWRQDDGALWEPNMLVRVDDRRLHVSDELLIAAVTLSRGRQGTVTELELTLPGAFDVLELPPAKKTTGWLW